jgi:hypothetical protein
MATINGVIHGNIIELERAPGLPDRQTVAVTIQQIDGVSPAAKSSQASVSADTARPSIEEVLASLAAQVPADDWQQLPADLSDDLDHYIYGTPKK